MTQLRTYLRGGRQRAVLFLALTALAVGGVVALPRPEPITVTGHFVSAVGLYPGDDVEILGVPVGSITSIRPGMEHTEITFTIRPDVPVPADVSAIVVAPNLLSARSIELAPVYTDGPKLPDRALIPKDRTAVPVEWDDIKDQLTALSGELGPREGTLQGPLSTAIDQAATTFAGSGGSFRDAVRELSRTAGRLGDSRFDLVGTIKNLRVLVDGLSSSNEQIVQFTGHVASLSQVFADSADDLAGTLDILNASLAQVRTFLDDNNAAIGGQAEKLTEFTTLLTEHSEEIEQVLHVAPNGLANFYNIYNPAQGLDRGDPVAAEPREPGAVPVRRSLRCRRDGRVLQAHRDLQATDGSGAQTRPDELPTCAVPPDQHNHRVQGPVRLRHSGNRNQGSYTGLAAPVATVARVRGTRDPTGHRPHRPAVAAGHRSGGVTPAWRSHTGPDADTGQQTGPGR